MYREIENLIHYIFPLSEALSGSSCLGLSRMTDLKYSVNCLTVFSSLQMADKKLRAKFSWPLSSENVQNSMAAFPSVCLAEHQFLNVVEKGGRDQFGKCHILVDFTMNVAYQSFERFCSKDNLFKFILTIFKQFDHVPLFYVTPTYIWPYQHSVETVLKMLLYDLHSQINFTSLSLLNLFCPTYAVLTVYLQIT